MDKNHNINVGKHGTFKVSGNQHTSPTDIDNLIAKLETEQITKIVLNFHGGLVNENEGIESAQKMNENILTTGVYPISFIWETGLMEIISEKAIDINKTLFFKKLCKFVIKKAGGKLSFKKDAKGFADLSDEEIESELEKESPFEDFQMESDTKGITLNEIGQEPDESLINELAYELEIDLEQDQEFKTKIKNIDHELDLVNKDLIEEKDDEGTKGIFTTISMAWNIAKISYQVIKRYVIKRDHGFYPTIVEEILRAFYLADFGAWVWGSMQGKAKELWSSNAELSGEDQYTGTYFLDKLHQYAIDKNIQIDLIGHSAGSIVICHLMQSLRANYPNLHINNIILLAPACKSELFHEVFLDETQATDFKLFRMFTMTDEAESKDNLIDKPILKYVYPRSLLYLVSGILEDQGEGIDVPILGMHRFFDFEHYYTKDAQLNDIRDFLLDQQRLVLSPVTGQPDGFNCTAIDHGYFNDDEETIKSIQFILKQNHI